jgi:cell division transport system permease protein
MNRRIDYPKAKAEPSSRTPNKKRKSSRLPSKMSLPMDKSDASAGANSPSQSSLLKAWFAHHRFSCLDSLQRLFATPWQSVMTWMVVAIALVLPAVLYLGLSNVQQLSESWRGNTQISAYIRYQAQPLAIEQLQQRLAAHPDIQSVGVITPEEAKQAFEQYSGLGQVMSSLDKNPLPTVLTIKPRADASTPNHLTILQNTLSAEPLIDFVQLDIGWLRRLQQMMALSQRIVLALAGLLGLGVLLIIGNTIRLSIENRRNEIVVIKMVGGTDGFVRRPFLYTGLWYGIGGGVLAILLLSLAGLWLKAPVQQLLFLYDSDYSLTWVSFNSIVFIIAGAALLGWIGAWLAVSRHLKHIEPV